TDAPNDFVMDDARFGGFERESVLAVFSELEFSSLVPRIPAGADEPAGAAKQAPAPGSAAATDVEVVDTPAALGSLVKRLAAARTVVFEAEASTPRAMEAGLVGLAFAVEEGHAYYVPVGHAEGKQLSPETVMDALGPVLRNDAVAKAGHNLNFGMTLLANHGIRPSSVRVGFDSMIAAHLVGEKALGLNPLAFNRLNVELTPLSDLVGTGRKQTPFDVVPIADAASYAGANADIALRLMADLEAGLERDGLTAFNRDHAMPLVPVLVQMQVHGIAIDTGVLAELDEELTVRIEQEERAAYEAVAHDFAISSPAQVGELLFKELKLPAGRRTQSGYSTDASILEGLRAAHPVVGHVLNYRELSKLKSTYTDTLPLEVNPRTNRIHTTYNQAGSATGRLASSDPNLQNIPVRTDLGMRVRRAFIAEARPDWVLLSADYSQIDLRALAHLSGDPALLAAFERDEDIHGSTASMIYGVSLDEVTPDMRRLAKVMNFGVAYGLSAFGISRQTEMTREEGAEFIDTYFTTYAKVREYLDETVRKAKETGYAETLLGRRRYLPELNASNFAVRQAGERMALNMPVQGTTSDIINAAMVQVQKRLEDDGMASKMLLQVHDELIFETPTSEIEALSEMLREVMPSALDLSPVPLKIDLKTGDNWADMS
ncbi:MAG: DNA polymerase I, partial [Chloroflexi bacterium]|nr:DNA polymerase I [Chloroflexota bacterium]